MTLTQVDITAGETARGRTRRMNPGSEYGITRNKRGGSRFWQVNLKRQGRHFSRLFYDGVYEDAEAARAEARAYRDALMAAFSPSTNAEAAERKSKKGGRASGIYEVRDHSGRLTGYRASLADGKQRKYRLFSIGKYGAEEALKFATEQRDAWRKERLMCFVLQNTEALRQATEDFPLRLSIEILPDAEDAIDERLRAIDAEFDARRPQFLTVSVRAVKERQLLLRVSNGGVPAVVEQVAAAYRRTSRADALQRLKARAAVFLRKFFGEDRSRQFLLDHGALFEDACFNAEKGIEVRERP